MTDGFPVNGGKYPPALPLLAEQVKPLTLIPTSFDLFETYKQRVAVEFDRAVTKMLKVEANLTVVDLMNSMGWRWHLPKRWHKRMGFEIVYQRVEGEPWSRYVGIRRRGKWFVDRRP